MRSLPGRRAFGRGLLALALLGIACAPETREQPGPAPRPPRPDTKPRHVIVILVDTLRADHLGAYGYARPTSPHFDAFAQGAVLFEDARAQASCTYPSVNSLLTSRPPEAFLAPLSPTPPGGAAAGGPSLGIPPDIAALPEILARRGYRTAAVSASPIVRKSPTRFNPEGGFDRGFEAFDEACLWQPAACVNDKALAHLRAPDPRPLLLYLHYIDPHGPYRPPAGHPRRFARSGPGEPQGPAKEYLRKGDPNPIADHLYKGAPDPGTTPADLQHLVDLYDDEIAYWDGQFGRLLAAIQEAGMAEETVIALVADHGEDFLEHGHVKHCRTLFDTSIKVPFVLRAPGIAPGVRQVQARNLDLVPTLLDLLGMPTEGEGLALEGRSLVPALRSPDSHALSASIQFAAQGALRSASDARHKLIADLAAGTYTLYDLTADPGETRDVLAETVQRDRRAIGLLHRALREHLARAGARLQGTQEAEKKLRALGYLE
ncbi:MAG TPA: sulfatase [Thermoanaerobaculia bacterium]|nr:sulfatase [Thermoanaerobaculia bacterium]